MALRASGRDTAGGSRASADSTRTIRADIARGTSGCASLPTRSACTDSFSKRQIGILDGAVRDRYVSHDEAAVHWPISDTRSILKRPRNRLRSVADRT